MKTSDEAIGSLGQAFETKNTKEGWYGKNMQVQSDPIIDPGTGQVLTIRLFEFKRNPLQKTLPDKQTLFNMHWRQIKQILWGDGLLAIEEESFQPRIEITPYKYMIFLTCKPRMGTFFAEKARPLQDYLKKP